MAKSQLKPSGALRTVWRPAGVPVLLYHGIAENEAVPVPSPERKFWITRRQFIDHLQTIQASEYCVGSLRDLWYLSAVATKLPLLALTFDDGHATDYTVAFPHLCEFRCRSDFFINTATVGSPGYLTWGQIAAMHGAGMSIQSHGHRHVDLSRLPLSVLRDQLSHSKRLIEDRLGQSVEFLSAPYGLMNRRVLEVALEEGYRAVCTSRNWPARMGGRQIGRVSIHSHTSRDELRGLLARDLSPYAARSVREALLYLPRQLLLRLNPTMLTVQTLGGHE